LVWVKVRAYGKAINSVSETIIENTKWPHPAMAETALLNRANWTAGLMTSVLTLQNNNTTRPTLFGKVFALRNGRHPSLKPAYISLHTMFTKQLYIAIASVTRKWLQVGPATITDSFIKLLT
jgi:hypothetical protein